MIINNKGLFSKALSSFILLAVICVSAQTASARSLLDLYGDILDYLVGTTTSSTSSSSSSNGSSNQDSGNGGGGSSSARDSGSGSTAHASASGGSGSVEGLSPSSGNCDDGSPNCNPDPGI